MDKKRFAAEATALVLIAVICATVANAVAARNRKVSWTAEYPNALVVPDQAGEVPLPAQPAAASEPATQTLLPLAADPAPDAAPEPPAGTGVIPQPAASHSPSAAPIQPAPTATPAKQFLPHPDVPWVEISGEDAADLHGRGVLVIDARRTDAFEQGHIAGSRSMPVWEADIDARVAALYEEGRDQNAPVVVYCSGGNCEDSHMLAQKLWGVGFDNVLVYKDGFPDWQKRGGAVARGPAQ